MQHKNIDGFWRYCSFFNGNRAIMKSVFQQSSFILLLAASLNCWPASQAAGLPVPKDFTVEAKEAHDRRLPILVLFMDKACSYCESVLEDFLLPMQRDPEFKNKVILRQIETGSSDALVDFDGNTTTYSRFSGKHKVSVVPNVMLFDSTGRALTSIEGLLTVNFYYGFLVKAIDESMEEIKANSR